MTVKSFVQEGSKILSPALLDVGPYTANEWASWQRAFFTADGATISGVRAGYLNALQVTNPSGSNIQVDTGAACVNGRLMTMDSALTWSVPSPVANPRVDVVCACLNNTAVARNTGIASGNPLLFPTVLTDYDGLSSIPPFTARPVILTGTEAASPVAPTLDSSLTTLFMVPLYQYQISTGGVISQPISSSTPLDVRHYDSVSPTSLILADEGSGSGGVSFDRIFNIPQYFNSLRIEFETKSPSGQTGNMSIVPNNDAVANRCIALYTENVGGALAIRTSNTGMAFPPPPTGNKYFMGGELTIPYYSRSRESHQFHGQYFYSDEARSSATQAQGTFSGTYAPAAPGPITTIRMVAVGSVGNVDIARYRIYGMM